MEQSYDVLAQNLASQIIEFRKKRNLTQNQLAQMAGIPRSTIANMECGMGNPSLLNLAKVSSALQVSMEELVAAPRPKVKMIRKNEIPADSRSKGTVQIFKLLPDPIPGMAIDRIELEPGARMAGVPHSNGTKEYLHCYQGEIVVLLAGEKHHLQAGDVFAFPGDVPHSYMNPGKEKAVSLSVVTLAL